VASDAAIQQHIFLSALEAGAASEFVIYERMAILSSQYIGSDYYQSNPDPLPELIRAAENEGLVVSKGYDWALTDQGRRWQAFNYDTFIHPSAATAA
jgi:hypothetical protein